MQIKNREKIVASIEGRFPKSSLEIIEGNNALLCIGWAKVGQSGFWAKANLSGELIQSWQILKAKDLLELVVENARVRNILQEGSITYGWQKVQGRQVLTVWGLGHNQLLYSTQWLMSGICLQEWTAYLPNSVNEKVIKRQRYDYKMCLRIHGSLVEKGGPASQKMQVI